MPTTRRNLEVGIICLLLAVITLAVYFPTLHHGFINLDDNGYVTDNRHVHAGLTDASVRWAFTSTEEANWHPLTWLSHMADCAVWKLNPEGHHLSAIVLHTMNVLLLFLLLFMLTGHAWRSAFVAALFAIHPLHVESVAWVAERKDVLSTFFWILTTIAYVYYARRPQVGRYVFVVVLFALGLMAKPMLVSLPVTLLLLDYWPLGRFSHGWKLVWEKVPLFALTLASCIVTYIAQLGTAVASLERYSVGVRIANALVSYAKYLLHMVWPANLVIFYPHQGTRILGWQPAVAVIVLALLTIFALRTGKRRPYLIFGWLWYVVTLVPVIGFVQVGNQAMADRYTYIPLIGIFVAITWAVCELFEKPAPEAQPVPQKPQRKGKNRGQEKTVTRSTAPNPVLAVAGVIVLAILLPLCYQQVGYWKDTATLFKHDVQVYPNDAAAHILIAYAVQDSDPEQAVDHYRESLRIDPKFNDACLNLASILAKQGMWDEAERQYIELLSRQPKNTRVYTNLGNVLIKKGDTRGAFQRFSQAIRVDPKYAEAYYNLGGLLMDDRRYDEAAKCFVKTVELQPDHANAHGNLAIVLYFHRKYPEAWGEVNLSRKYGKEPHPGFIAALAREMPEPKY